jgi:hypothetical protein
MPSLQTRLHPGVIPPATATWRQRGRSAHLRQGSLEGACGPYACFSALIVLGVASRAHVRCLRLIAEGDRLEQTWRRSQEFFFSGADDRDMVKLLGTLDQYVRHRLVTGSMRQVLAFTLQRLAKDDVVILGLNSESTYGGHWVLAVGIELIVKGSTRTITGVLCLDSAEEAPVLTPFNTRLDLESPGRGARYLHYRLPTGAVQTITCKTAIALSRRR